MPMKTFVDNLKTQSENNPLLALAIAAGLISTSSKLMNALSNSRNSRAWSQEVSRRAMKDRQK